jgi:hypothetical protein
MSPVSIRGLCGRFVSLNNRAGAVILLAVALGAGAVFGQGHTLWQNGGVQLCGTSADIPLLAVSDSAGGAIVVWQDTRQSLEGIYAQRVSADGVPQWTENGVLLCDSTGETNGYFDVIDDGRDGAIAVWGPPWRSFAVQRVSADGVPLWGSHGLVLRPPRESLVEWPALVRDGHSGAIVVWNAICPYTQVDTLIACRVDSSGTKQWETVVRIDTLGDTPPRVCEDGLGGVIVVWSSEWGPVRVQRVDSAGSIKWGSAGVLACTLSVPQGERACVPVGESRFLVGWFCGGGGAFQHRAQMLDLAGNRLWELAGAPISGVFNSTSSAVGLSANGREQSAWLWSENTAGTYDFFAQKLDSAGSRRWDSMGVFVGSSDTSQGGFSATVDDRGGAIVAWPLHRSGLNWDLYAQHVDSAGHLCWSDTGLAVCLDSNRQEWTPANVTDGAGGAILAWLDDRGIYAQRVADRAGVEEATNDEVRAANTGPTVAQGVLFLSEAPSRKPQAASLLDASGRRIAELHAGANDASHLAPGVYFVRSAQAQAHVVHKVIIAR